MLSGILGWFSFLLLREVRNPLFYGRYLDFYKITLFLAVPGLCCCLGFSLSSHERGGYSLVNSVWASHCVAFLVGEHRLWVLRRHSCGSPALEHRLSRRGAWALSLHGMRGLSGSGMEPVSPALAGRFFTTEPSGKPWIFLIVGNPVLFTTMRSKLNFQMGQFQPTECQLVISE